MANTQINLFAVFMFLCLRDLVSGIQCKYYNDYYDDYLNYGGTFYCATSCCGTSYSSYCCEPDSTTGTIIGIYVGSSLLVLSVVTVVIVACCCCCRRSRGQPGQVFQRATVTTTVIGMQPVSSANVGQVRYINSAYPQQIQTANVAPGTAHKWQDPPPAYSAANAEIQSGVSS